MNFVDRTIRLRVRLFGVFSASWDGGTELRIRSVKQRAILAMLITAPEGARTRAWLQDKLWNRSGHEHGRASLRRALTDLRNVFGEHFGELFEVSNTDIQINLQYVERIDSPFDGEFLEGVDIGEEGFEEWIREERLKQSAMSSGISQAAQVKPRQIEELKIPGFEHTQPTLAILPFSTARGYDGTGQLGDMIAEEVSRSLSRSYLIDVISHLSCRTLDARQVAMNDIRAALDADYLVCGNYRADGDKIRLHADFIDTRTGRIAWTRELEGSQSAFLQGDEAVIRDLATEVGYAVSETAVSLAENHPVPDVETHTLLMSGITLMHRQSVAGFARAKNYLEEVIRRVPANSFVHAWMAKWYVLSVVQGWSRDLNQDAQIATDLTAKALDLNSECSISLAIDGFVHNNLLKRFDIAMERYSDAIEVDPNNALAWLLKGTFHAFTDQGEMAVAYTKRARSLSPLDPHRYFFDSLSATACLSAGDYETALELANVSLRANRRHTSTLRVLVIALQKLGREIEAKDAADRLMRIDPNLTISSYLANHPAALFNSGREWASALRGAGVPE